ncbi:MAG: hypothetical protein HKN70_09190, partial [Gammaproteobacteria bacterium]|nr:hypothetical protein [Gammaproteobacteria bacterium]
MTIKLAASALLIVLIALPSCVLTRHADDHTRHNNDAIQNRGAGKDAWWNALPRRAWTRLERVRT